MKRLLKDWQVGDGREGRLALYVVARARRGDDDPRERLAAQMRQ